MKINRTFLDQVTKRLDVVSASGRSTIEQIMLSAPEGFDYDELFAYVCEQYLPIAKACADNAAVLGANAYDTYREMEVGSALGALPDSGFDDFDTMNAVGAFVNDACDQGDMSILVDMLGRRIDAQVMRSYTNSQVVNSKGDPMHPRFARIPSGINTCDFCRALAGHGFFYTSKETAGDDGGKFNTFHDFCRCQVVPEFSAEARQLEVEGYDPQVYVEEWRRTRKQFGTGAASKPVIRGAVKMTPTGRPSTAMPEIDKPVLKEPPEPEPLPEKVYGGEWDQAKDMDDFLRTMFDDDDYVGTCAEFYDKDGRRVPTKGYYQRSAKQIENVLDNTHNVASAVGRYRVSDGAYVRINPLDGRGVSDANVVSFKYALVECDTLAMDQQYGYIKALNLPTQAVVTSGGKSVHAVVRVDAKDLTEYKQRVALLQAECKASGFDIDTTTKNPSRYMRIPGVRRGSGRQVLVSTHQGAKSWDEWREWCDKTR